MWQFPKQTLKNADLMMLVPGGYWLIQFVFLVRLITSIEDSLGNQGTYKLKSVYFYLLADARLDNLYR